MTEQKYELKTEKKGGSRTYIAFDANDKAYKYISAMRRRYTSAAMKNIVSDLLESFCKENDIGA